MPLLGEDKSLTSEASWRAPTLGPSLPPCITRQALFETTKRVLAAAVNEGLAIANIEASASRTLLLHPPIPRTIARGDIRIKCGIRDDAYIENDGLRALGYLRADDVLSPVLVQKTTGEVLSEELDPGVICRIICSWQPQLPHSEGIELLVKEVQNAAANQVKWLEIAASLPEMHLMSPFSDWEQSNILGHPTHPLHRTCIARSPMRPITPDDIPGLRAPEISFLSLPRSDLKVTGPFEQLLAPLLESLEIPKESEQRIIVPCFTRQLPSIKPLFPQARHIRSVQDCCRAQMSTRTISLLPKATGNFPSYLKMSLDCQITTTTRNISPWAAFLGPTLSRIFLNLVSPDLWMFEEPASITGAQHNIVEAGYLSCIIRQLPKQQVQATEEILIPATGLYQTPSSSEDNRTYMEILFGLDNLKKKQQWFRKYLALLLPSLMRLLVRYGIGFESHLQNVIARVNITTKEITGFAIRDLDGTRIHYPTFRRSGYDLDLSEKPCGDTHFTDDLQGPLHHVHKTLFQENVGHILYKLGLESHGGWSIVRDELEKALDPSEDRDGKVVYDFFLKEKMPLYRFLGMRLFGRVTESCQMFFSEKHDNGAIVRLKV